MKAIKLLIAVVILFWLTLSTQAEVPKLLNYQGKLTTAEGACVDTTVSMQFAIYSDSTGEDLLWTETQPFVQVKDGIFSVLLGSVDSIPESVFTGDIRYLGVKVEDDPEMIPRKAIVSVGYAYNSDMLDGKKAGNQAGNIPISNGNLNVNLNADYLDGFDSQTFLSPVNRVIRDTMWVWPSPRTKEFSPPIDPSKAVVLLGQGFYNCNVHVYELTSSSITVGTQCYTNGQPGCLDYQIIEYK